MPTRKDRGKTAGMSDAAVQRATGRVWAEWFKLLDGFGARKMPHKEIAERLYAEHPDVGGWWCQMITVGYEQARGLRVKHERPDGFSVSSSKTIAVPVARAFGAWKDGRLRARWLSDSEMHVRKATANRSMRITWDGGDTRLDVNFYAKGPGKSQVAVEHQKLPDARAAQRMKRFWSERLSDLKELLEA